MCTYMFTLLMLTSEGLPAKTLDQISSAVIRTEEVLMELHDIVVRRKPG